MKNSLNKDIVETILHTIIEIGSRATSRDYIIVVMDTLVRKLSKRFKAFKYVHIKTTTYSSATSLIKISYDIDKISPKYVGLAVNELIKEISGPSSGRNKKNDFLLMLNGYLGRENILKLKNMGVTILGK